MIPGSRPCSRRRKKDVVKGRFCFVAIIELCAVVLMLVSVSVRMPALADAEPYGNNALMNANLFAVGVAFFIFGLFNLVFVGGFFKTAYKVGVRF